MGWSMSLCCARGEVPRQRAVTTDDVSSRSSYRGISPMLKSVAAIDAGRARQLRLKQPWLDFLSLRHAGDGRGLGGPRHYVERVARRLKGTERRGPIALSPSPGVELVLKRPRTTGMAQA